MIDVICRRVWPFPDWVDGIVLWPFIFFNGEPVESLRFHEYVHVAQIKKHGVIKWYALYLYYNFSYGYLDNPFEVDARRLTDEFIANKGLMS